MTPKIARFLQEEQPATPCLVLDLDRVAENYRAFHDALPQARIYYAVKANSAPPILRRLAEMDSHFDTASYEEVIACLEAGAPASRLSYGSTIKKISAIRDTFRRGVRLYAFDTVEELEKLAQHAPGARVYCRLTVENAGADWPLSRKFGTSAALAGAMMRQAAGLGLEPYGLSFHVGSQQTTTAAYERAIHEVAPLYKSLTAGGVGLRMLNLGGGFPTRYRDDVPPISAFAAAITRAMNAEFGADWPEVIVEPGRYIVGDAGQLSTEVVLVSHKRDDIAPQRWVYLDIGRFGGLAETEGEAIKYAFATAHDGAEAGPVTIAGPTCDGVDILYETERYTLPLALKPGDRVDILSAGAYVTCYASRGYNGFAAPGEYYI